MIHVIHRGKGIFVIIAGILCALVMQIITAKYFGDEYYAAHNWPKVGALWLLAAICLAGGAYLRARPTQLKHAKQEYFYGESNDHLFFIPVIYWSLIFFVLGLAFLAYKLAKTGT